MAQWLEYSRYSHEMGVTCSTHNKESTPHPLVSPAPRVAETGLLGSGFQPCWEGTGRVIKDTRCLLTSLSTCAHRDIHGWMDGWAPLVPHMKRVPRLYLMTHCNVLGEVVEEQEILIVSSPKFLSTAFAFWIHFPFHRKDNLTVGGWIDV